MDYRMDPQLKKACQGPVQVHCMNELQEIGTGTVEECLKAKLQEGLIKDKTCMKVSCCYKLI